MSSSEVNNVVENIVEDVVTITDLLKERDKIYDDSLKKTKVWYYKLGFWDGFVCGTIVVMSTFLGTYLVINNKLKE